MFWPEISSLAHTWAHSIVFSVSVIGPPSRHVTFGLASVAGSSRAGPDPQSGQVRPSGQRCASNHASAGVVVGEHLEQLDDADALAVRLSALRIYGS